MVATTLSLTSGRGDAALANTTRQLQRDLEQADVPAHAVEAPLKAGEKGDAFSLGQIAIDLVTSGAITGLIACLKAYLERDESLKVSLKRPDGSSLEIESHNIDSANLREDLRTLLPPE